MKVGIVVIAEPLETDPNSGRPFRGGMLATALAEAGHDVTWWTSNFDHARKCHRFPGQHQVEMPSGYKVRFLHGPAYRSNVSLARLAHNRSVTKAFASDLRTREPELDVMFVCVPTHELATVALAYGRRRGIPVVLDIRDPWPDHYLTVFPARLRPIARLGLSRSFARARRNFAEASALVAVSQTYLEWARTMGQRAPRSTDRVFPIGFPADGPGPSAGRAATPGSAQEHEPLIATFAGTFGVSYDLEAVVLAGLALEEAMPGRVRVCLAGDGDQRARLESLVAGATCVEFSGWLGKDELAELLQRSSVGLIAYRSDSQTLTNKLFEYLAAGLPVISSLGGEVRRLVEDEGIGLSYEPGDADSLRTAILWMVEHDDEREAMAKRARQLFEDRYSAEKIYSELREYLEGLVADGR